MTQKCDCCGRPATRHCAVDCGMSLCGAPLCDTCRHVDRKFGWTHMALRENVDLTAEPNAADFSFVEKPDEFRVTLQVIGEVRLTIKADDIEAARADARLQAEKMLDGDDGFGVELDDVEQVSVAHVQQSPRMYRVLNADGMKCQVSHLKPGMTPREPDEKGF